MNALGTKREDNADNDDEEKRDLEGVAVHSLICGQRQVLMNIWGTETEDDDWQMHITKGDKRG
jgi:hypothetical protein